MKLIKHTVYSEMYFIELHDGEMSRDFYNLTRATELLRRLEKGEKINTVRIGYDV